MYSITLSRTTNLVDSNRTDQAITIYSLRPRHPPRPRHFPRPRRTS